MMLQNHILPIIALDYLLPFESQAMRMFQNVNHLIIVIMVMASAHISRTAFADMPFMILQSTTSTQNSGLYDHLLPRFTEQSGIEVRVVAVGTGQALRNARNCDGDLLLVHSKPDEEDFVNAGYGAKRRNVMYNDFVVVGPNHDPAGINKADTVAEALQMIYAQQSKFATRGDDSGTHKAELRLWQSAGLSPDALHDQWYLDTGLGMGATLNFAVQANSYAISDRGTWIAFANKANHKILFESDPPLFNQYGVVTINAERCPHVKQVLAENFASWLVSPTGQKHIGAYRRNGVQLFFPNADR
ncbi:substrate-binding domain-containing protein [uncultured Candidatus Puniceispirillum sp.]|uniref:substrate-binding domain-containing protein n=2 Tax=Candidatus Puniceispirillum TaxID=767891 RepID=UPI0032B27B85